MLAAPLTAEEIAARERPSHRLSRGRRPRRSASSGPPPASSRAWWRPTRSTCRLSRACARSTRAWVIRPGSADARAVVEGDRRAAPPAPAAPVPSAPPPPPPPPSAPAATRTGCRGAGRERGATPCARGFNTSGRAAAPGGATTTRGRSRAAARSAVRASTSSGRGLRAGNDGRAGRPAGDGRRGRPCRARARWPAPSGAPARTAGRAPGGRGLRSRSSSCRTPCASTGARRSGWAVCWPRRDLSAKTSWSRSCPRSTGCRQ